MTLLYTYNLHFSEFNNKINVNPTLNLKKEIFNMQ